MTNKFLSMVAGVALLAVAGAAHAGQPLVLTNGQMDSVTAGEVAFANAAALALGEVIATTFVQTNTEVNNATFPSHAVGEAFSTSLAAGGIDFQALAVSHSDSAAHF